MEGGGSQGLTDAKEGEDKYVCKWSVNCGWGDEGERKIDHGH